MIGRVDEKRELQALLDEDDPQFVAVLGRRRIGKTYLVRESFNYHFTFEHSALSVAEISQKQRTQAQLDCFADSLRKAGLDLNTGLSSWKEAFDGLKKVIESSDEKKKVIFIDELSWMDTGGSGLLSALENFWNGWAAARRQKDVILIVCASATYWMIDNVVNSRGGLHNRLTGQIFLKPFTLKECEEYVRSKNIVMNRYQILECYMIMGGVPYYWSLLKKGMSLQQNIDNIFFRENAPLANEYDNLYKALFDRPDQYIRIIEALSAVKSGITRSEIIEKTGINGSGDFSRKLKELENCGFIRKYVPFGSKRRNSLYQLIDNFTLFYFKFMKEKVYDEAFWTNRITSQAAGVWKGLAFERVCLEHVPQIKKALGISGVETTVNAWVCRADPDNGIFGSQIDLLIVRRDQVINLCEMKYSEEDYAVNASFDMSMRHKISDLHTVTGTKYNIYPTLITTYGVIQNSYSMNLQSVLTADDLFA